MAVGSLVSGVLMWWSPQTAHPCSCFEEAQDFHLDGSLKFESTRWPQMLHEGLFVSVPGNKYEEICSRDSERFNDLDKFAWKIFFCKKYFFGGGATSLGSSLFDRSDIGSHGSVSYFTRKIWKVPLHNNASHRPVTISAVRSLQVVGLRWFEVDSHCTFGASKSPGRFVRVLLNQRNTWALLN